MSKYYIENKETGKIELHFDKADYMALTEEEKSKIKSNFLFSRYSSAWISRRKYPNLYLPIEIAKELGLEDQGTTGERLSFEEQEGRRIEKAERRADRYEYKSDKAYKECERLQKPINDMHGDIAFFTQPNINTSAGRAFTRKRDKMWASYERGFEEFRKSEYYQERARKARENTKVPDIAFCQRRIDEAEKAIRQLKKWRELDEERIEAEVSKIAYYDSLIQAQGGIKFSKDNVNKGDIVKVGRWGNVKVYSKGPKNFTFEFLEAHMTYADGSPMQGKAAYTEILEIAN